MMAQATRYAGISPLDFEQMEYQEALFVTQKAMEWHFEEVSRIEENRQEMVVFLAKVIAESAGARMA